MRNPNTGRRIVAELAAIENPTRGRSSDATCSRSNQHDGENQLDTVASRGPRHAVRRSTKDERNHWKSVGEEGIKGASSNRSVTRPPLYTDISYSGQRFSEHPGSSAVLPEAAANSRASHAGNTLGKGFAEPVCNESNGCPGNARPNLIFLLPIFLPRGRA